MVHKLRLSAFYKSASNGAYRPCRLFLMYFTAGYGRSSTLHDELGVWVAGGKYLWRLVASKHFSATHVNKITIMKPIRLFFT